MSHPAITTWLLAGVTWAALSGVMWLSRPLYRRRLSVADIEPGSPDAAADVGLAEFVTDAPAFDSAYAVSPDGPAGDEQ